MLYVEGWGFFQNNVCDLPSKSRWFWGGPLPKMDLQNPALPWWPRTWRYLSWFTVSMMTTLLRLLDYCLLYAPNASMFPWTRLLDQSDHCPYFHLQNQTQSNESQRNHQLKCCEGRTRWYVICRNRAESCPGDRSRGCTRAATHHILWGCGMGTGEHMTTGKTHTDKHHEKAKSFRFTWWRNVEGDLLECYFATLVDVEAVSME